MIETKMSLFVSMKKSAEASMMAIAVSNDVLLHQIMQTKIKPMNKRIPPPIINSLLEFEKPEYNINPPPPKNEIKRRATAHMARHLAQLLINHMNPIAVSIPVKSIATNDFHVAYIFVNTAPASLDKNSSFNFEMKSWLSLPEMGFGRQ